MHQGLTVSARKDILLPIGIPIGMCNSNPFGTRSVIPGMAEELPRMLSEGLAPRRSSHFLIYMQGKGHRDHHKC